MGSSAAVLNASEAAGRLGVSVKALRLYEQRGLIVPARSEAGWRAYGPAEMARAGEIVALRALGLSLARVARVLDGDQRELESALAAHQAALEAQARHIAGTIAQVRGVRAGLAQGHAPISVSFDLPWPWGGERFELRDIMKLTYVIGPLGSGKTRLAQRLAETLPGAKFLGLDRLAGWAPLESDPALTSRVDAALAWLMEEGAGRSEALLVLLTALEAQDGGILVIDMVEQGLDQPTQEALAAYLRRRPPEAPKLFLLTRSSAILDLAAVGPDEAILHCPANHSPPGIVAPVPGAPGYEAVATCLASPEVRARTEGVIAWRPQAA